MNKQSIFLILLIASVSSIAMSWPKAITSSSDPLNNGKCIQIFYDKSADPNYRIGKIYSIFLQNLLAHFPQYQQIVGPIEQYRSKDLDRCAASFYLGSYFENNIPKEFFDDYSQTQKPVVWMGYSIWKPGLDYFEKIFGYKYSGLTKLNTTTLDPQGRPTFFKFATYKGEQFRKYGEFSKVDPTIFLAPFENIVLTKTVDNPKVEKISELIHNGTGDRIPYILRSENKYYIADCPFSFMHEADRFLIITDLFFDILNEPPMHNEKIAFMRIEDVFPMIGLPYMYDVLNVLKQFNVKAQLSVVPFFADPLKNFPTLDRFIAIENSPSFIQLITDAKQQGHQIIWHGVTHQYESEKNPFSGVSTEDFEFWNAITNTPVAKDSTSWVLNRLEDGVYSMRLGGADFKAWLTPHYQASALDYLIFSRVFEWNVGRVIYFDYTAQNVPSRDSSLLMSNPSSTLKNRLSAFQNMKVQTQGQWVGQMFPYLIYGDIYGQRIIPEALGNSQPYLSEHVIWPRSIDDILADAKRNLVLRDNWASVFYHSNLLNTIGGGGRGDYPGDSTDLKKLISGIQQMGYRFVTMDEINQRWNFPARKETLALEETR